MSIYIKIKNQKNRCVGLSINIYIYIYIYIHLYILIYMYILIYILLCYTRRDNLCCQQVQKANVFKSYKTGKTYTIFHQLTCKSQAIIYLLQCRICFIQYVGKRETIFNLRLNNHRKDSKKKDAILACTHFQKSNHIFQRVTKFVLIEQIAKKYNTIEERRLTLKKREKFWIMNLRTHYPNGLNQELNNV